MPGMSGLELLPKAKAMRPDVPIIMITAYGDAETKRKALRTAPRRFLRSRSTLGLCVPKARSALIGRTSPLTSAHHDLVVIFRNDGLLTND